ncbi:hypothetical protein OSTOST_14558 [Ostertagia ostertagi]
MIPLKGMMPFVSSYSMTLSSTVTKKVDTRGIEKLFLMMALHPDCRDYTRFLWMNDATQPLTSINILTKVVTPLSQALSEHLCRQRMYVFHGVSDVADEKKFYADSKELFR